MNKTEPATSNRQHTSNEEKPADKTESGTPNRKQMSNEEKSMKKYYQPHQTDNIPQMRNLWKYRIRNTKQTTDVK